MRPPLLYGNESLDDNGLPRYSNPLRRRGRDTQALRLYRENSGVRPVEALDSALRLSALPLSH
jgi:hypothetical protein